MASSNTVLKAKTLSNSPSGIVVDNYSTASRASSIDLMAGRKNTA
jgi:hypothetical protein